MARHSKLETLNIAYNELDESCVPLLSMIVAKNPNLKSVVLTGNDELIEGLGDDLMVECEKRNVGLICESDDESSVEED